jgi:uncharacterized protein HemY
VIVHMEGNEVVVQISKAVLVMTRERFIECLRQGKRWRRQQAMAQRLTKLAQDPRSVSVLGDESGDRSQSWSPAAN